MPIVEVDGLNRVGDMSFTYNTGNGPITAYFKAGRFTTVTVGQASYLIAGSEDRGIAVAQIEPNGGLDFIGAYGASGFDRFEGYEFDTMSITHHQVGSSTYVYLSGSFDYLNGSTVDYHRGLAVFEVAANGGLDLIQTLDLEDAPTGGGVVSSFGSDPQVVEVGSKTMLVLNPWDRDNSFQDVQTYEILGDGTLQALQRSDPFTYQGGRFEVASVGNRDFVVMSGQYNIAPLQVLRLKASGEAVPVYEVLTSESAIYNRNTGDMVTAEIGGRTFVLVTETTGGSILVFELERSGRLSLVEQEKPGTGDAWGYAEALEVFEEGGRTYLATAGYARGLGVFEISAGGALTEVEEFVFQDSAVRYGYDIDSLRVNGDTYLLTSMHPQDELRSFRFVPQDDWITGRNKKDKLKGTAEDDQIDGRGGNDVLLGKVGDDMIEGADGKDTLKGQGGDDNLYGGSGRDKVLGGGGNDFLFGDSGKDMIKGQAGNDYAAGGSANDKIYGSAGNDRLFGDDGNDLLSGGAGNDVLTDGDGRDLLKGDAGADVFVLVDDGERDKLLDYEDGTDRIDLREEGRNLEFSDLVISQKGSKVLVKYGDDQILITEADGQIFDYELSLGDFIFH